MATSIKIGGTTYKAVDDYEVKQQGGAVSTTRFRVLLESNPVPVILSQAQVYLDATLFFAGLIQRVSSPEYSSTYEANVFSIEVSSLECLFNNLLVTKNFYDYSYTSWAEVVQYLFTNYIAAENITLGAISTISTSFDSRYSVKDKKLFDVLNDIASTIGNAAWWVTPDRKFYFSINTDFTAVTPPAHARNFQLVEELGDVRTEEKITGASAGVVGTASNTTLRATLAARTGGSGKIERAESDGDIHSDTKAATEAARRLTIYDETQKTITCVCEDMAASTIYSEWALSLTINGIVISGDYVVTERTITARGPDLFDIAVTLRNHNFFARYGYTLKEVATITNENTAVIADIADDEKLTPGEKIAELAKWLNEQAAQTSYDAEADQYSVSRVAYDAAFVALSTLLNAGVAWTSGTPAWFNGEAYTETTVIVKATYDAAWQLLYTEKTALEIALRAAIQEAADDAIAAAQEASIRLSLTTRAIERSRAGVLDPASITAAALYGYNGSAYAGRFEIAHSTDGVTYDADEGCPNDPAGTTYLQRLWPTVDSWSGNTGTTASVSGGKLIATKDAVASSGTSAYHELSTWNGKHIRLRVVSQNDILNFKFYRGPSASPVLTDPTSIEVISAKEWIVDWIVDVTGYAFCVWYVNYGYVAANVVAVNFVYVGTGAALWYQSPSDESSHAHTLPVTSFNNYVVLVRARLYKAGGFITVLKEDVASITASASVAPIYWGSLTSAPTTGICVNDYYFDANTIAGGGGIVRYWTGTTWAEMTSAHALWKQAWGNLEVLTDASEWANAQASVVAAATAIFNKLFASYVVAAFIFAQQIEVPSGGRIRYYNGQGVQRRCVQLAEDRIDWMDTPDTSPASDELLVGRIGRLGVASPILLDGEFSAAIEQTLGPNIVINPASSNDPKITQTTDGQVRVAYIRRSDYYLCERLFDGTAWGSESVINAAVSGSPTYLQTLNGVLRIMYQISTGHLRERIWSGSAWGTETTVTSNVSNNPALIQTEDGQIRLAYTVAAPSNNLVERLYGGGAWGSENLISTAIFGSAPSYTEWNGVLRISYTNAAGNLAERTWDGSTWSSERAITTAAAWDPNYVVLLNNTLKVIYRLDAADYIVERAWSGTAWGVEVVINAVSNSSPDVIQLNNGDVHYVFISSGSSQVWEKIRTGYAQLGAGIIESGISGSGRYRKWSDGRMEYAQRGLITTSTTVSNMFGSSSGTTYYGSATVTLPAGFIAIDALLGTTNEPVIGSTIIVYYNSLTQCTVYMTTGSARADNDYSLLVVGRWK